MVVDDNDTWDDQTIVTWDYEGANVIFVRQWRKIPCGYCSVIKGLVIEGNFNDLLCQHKTCCG
jgi:hypothetical protein